MRSVVAVLALALAAQVGPAAPQRLPTLTPGPAVILGRVVEAGTTSGVSGAVVTLASPALGPETAFFSDGTQGGPRILIADSEGRFAFRNLPAGPYNITTTAAGFVNGAYGQTRIVQIPRTLDVPRPLDLTDNDRPANATVTMWKLGGISGVIRDELGEPMVTVPVSVLARVTDWGGVIMQSTTSQLTDDRGMYHMDVAPGDYIVGVLSATTTFSASSSDAFQRAIAEGSDAQRAYIDLIIAGGSVMPRGVGTRVGGLVVGQWSQNDLAAVPPIFQQAPAFYPSTFHPSSLTPVAATIVSVGSGEEKAGVNIDLRPIPARRVSGRVVGPAGPMPHISLRLVGNDPATLRTSPATLIDVPQALADANGEFTFLGVAPGSYRLRVIRLSDAPDEPFLWNTDAITVGDTDVVDLQVTMQVGAQIRGRLMVDSTNAPPTPVALRSVTIAARPVPGSLGALQTSTSINRLDDAGRFTTRPLIPGPYIMTIGGFPSGWILKSVTTGGQNAVDTPFELSSVGITDMVITITDRISTLSGTVRDDSGRPSGSATVGVFPVSRTLWRLPGIASRRVQVVLPGRDGRYSFRGLPAGDYVVVAVDGAAVDFSDPAALTALMSQPTAARLTLADGDNKTQDLAVTIVRER